MIKFLIKFSAWALAILIALVISLLYLNYIGFDGGFTTQTTQGDVDFNAGNYKDALAHYNSASKKSPSNAKAKINLVDTLILLERQDDAIEVLEKFIKDYPNTTREVYEKLISLYETTNADSEKQLALLEQAANIFSDTGFADLASTLKKKMTTVYAPTVDIQGGSYENPITVKVTNLDKDESVYYTLDGISPDNKSAEYSQSKGIEIAKGKYVLKLIKYKPNGAKSDVVTLSYKIGTVQDDSDKATITAVYGNNAMNGGLVSAYSGLVFYCNTASSKKIYRCLPQGSNDEMICSDKASYLNAANDSLYYINESDGNRIYSIALDGSNRTAISDDAAIFMLTAGEYIFYSNKTDGNKLYRMKLDGSEKTVVTSDRVTQFNIVSGTIYYRNDTDKEYLYSINYDGTDRKKLISQRAYSLNIYNSTIYYINMDDGSKIYTAALDGSGARVFSAALGASEILVDSAGIYYIDKSTKDICMLNFDGNVLTQIETGANASKLNIAYNLLYYVNYSNATDMKRRSKS